MKSYKKLGKIKVPEFIPEKTTSLHVVLSMSLHRDLKIKAAQMGKGVTITFLVTEALKDYLKKVSMG